MAKDYYEQLGVARDATDADIKKAFRTIARECHPDRTGGDPAAEERFKAAQVAYQTLMDPVTRARYDRRGQRRAALGKGGSFFDAFYKATGDGQDPGSVRPGGRPGRAKPKPRNDMSLDDLFNVGEFGFGSKSSSAPDPRNRRAAPRPSPARGADVQIELEVPEDVARRGGSVTAVYRRQQRGDSWRPGSPDPGLDGVEDIADIRIVPGTRSGMILRERGLGHAGSHGGPYGDLVARVRVVASSRPKPPPRSPPPPRSTPPPPATPPPGASASASDPAGDPQVQVLEIGVVEALLGGRVAFDTPVGGVRLTIPPCTSSGARMRLKGKGSPVNGQATDLYVEMRIVTPSSLDAESRALIEQFAQLNPSV